MEYGTLYLTRYLSIYMPLNMENSTSRTEKKKVLHDKITLKLHKQCVCASMHASQIPFSNLDLCKP